MRELIAIGAAGLFTLALCTFLLATFVSGSIMPWWLGATALWFYCWWQAWQRRHLNRATMAAAPFAELGWANRLTLLRGWLIAWVGGFVLLAPAEGWIAWLPGLLYCAAVLLDAVDGVVARRTDRVSLLGKALDTEMDALGLLVAPLLAVVLGKLHWSFLAVSAAYYVFVAGLYWRRRRGLPVYPLPPSAVRRVLAGSQMSFVALALLPVFPASGTRLLGVAFMLPILAGFAVDWLAVSGRMPPSAASERWRQRVAGLGSGILLPGLRVLVGALILQGWLAGAWWLLASGSLALLIVSGIAARTASGAVLIVGCALMGDSLSWQSAAILCACGWITLLGSGRFSIWRGDDIWLARRG